MLGMESDGLSPHQPWNLREAAAGDGTAFHSRNGTFFFTFTFQYRLDDARCQGMVCGVRRKPGYMCIKLERKKSKWWSVQMREPHPINKCGDFTGCFVERDANGEHEESESFRKERKQN